MIMVGDGFFSDIIINRFKNCTLDSRCYMPAPSQTGVQMSIFHERQSLIRSRKGIRSVGRKTDAFRDFGKTVKRPSPDGQKDKTGNR